jgi:dihydroxyacetone kinase-like protein
MEVGIGHHGEPGVRVEPLKTAKQMALEMVDLLVPDLPFVAGHEVVVLVSGLGATPVMELYILYDEVERLLLERNITVFRPYVGNYFTSLEMQGATLTLMKLDPELKQLIELDSESMGLTQFSGITAPAHS